jgi:hypothetical protein
MPWSGQEELLRTKARLVRDLRQRTLRRQRQLLSPAEDLYSDSDSETEPESKIDKAKSVPLSQYKRDLRLTVIRTLLLTIAASLLVSQYLLIRRA